MFPLFLKVRIVEASSSANFYNSGPVSWTRTTENYEIDWWSWYLPTEVNANSSCGKALSAMQNALGAKQPSWAHKMVDSWGKSIHGIFIGNIFFRGVYDECVFASSPDEKIHGSYCTINLRKSSTKNETVRATSSLPWGTPGSSSVILDVIKGILPNGSSINYATCIPDACSPQEMEESLGDVLNSTDFIVSDVQCKSASYKETYGAAEIIYVSALVFLASLLILASAVDIYILKTENTSLAKGRLRYFLPFSAYTNLQKLFHLNTEDNPKTINCLHGIRVLSMTWVIVGHQEQIALVTLNTINSLSVPSKMDSLIFQSIGNGFLSVDTFFFLSGFLMSFILLNEFKKTGKFNIVIFYVHRLIRLMPPIAIVGGFYCTIAGHFFNGPAIDAWPEWKANCKRAWWKDVIFVDNFLGHECLGQAWYLAVDFQLYVIAPLVMLPLLFNKYLGQIWLYILTLLSIIIPSWITYVRDLPPTNLVLHPKGGEFNDVIYFMPWNRAGPWIIGIWLGLIFHNQNNKKRKLKAWQVVTGWTVAVTVGLLVTFGMWQYNIIPPKAQYDVVTQVVYAGLHRPAWGAALAWVVFACYNGYGGLVDDFLSHPIWQPLSRLTYVMYLVALPLQFTVVFNARTLYYYTHYNKIIESVGVVVLAVIPSVLITLGVESPIIGLEKLLLKQQGSGREARNKKPEGIDNEAFEKHEEIDKREKEEI